MRSKRKNRAMKGVYVVKSAPDEKLRELAPKKRTESRSVYVLRTSEEVLNKYSDTVYDFVDVGGIFVLLGADKVFYQTFKRSVVFELGIESEFILLLHEQELLMPKLEELARDGLTPFVFLDHSACGNRTPRFLSEIKQLYPKTPVIVLDRHVDKDHLLQYYEEGADHVLNKSASVNEIIRKIVHILKPETEVDELVNAGNRLNSDNRFEDAIKVANSILTKRPKSPRAHMILGDAYKGLAKRRQAMDEYLEAEKNSRMFIDPLKKIFIMHAEDQNKGGMLDYLVKLDDMSPLNFNRKVKIGDLSYDLGKFQDAEQYYDNAIDSAVSEARSIVGEMSLDIAEKLAGTNPDLAAKYFRKSLDLVRETRDFASMNTFNRLGISLRKAGLWKEAVDAYSVAEQLSPGDENLQYNMGLAFQEGKDFGNALQKMIMALRINPKMYVGKADIAYSMGLVFQENNRAAEAEKFFKHVLEIAPDHDGAREQLERKSA